MATQGPETRDFMICLQPSQSSPIRLFLLSPSHPTGIPVHHTHFIFTAWILFPGHEYSMSNSTWTMSFTKHLLILFVVTYRMLSSFLEEGVLARQIMSALRVLCHFFAHFYEIKPKVLNRSLIYEVLGEKIINLNSKLAFSGSTFSYLNKLFRLS